MICTITVTLKSIAQSGSGIGDDAGELRGAVSSLGTTAKFAYLILVRAVVCGQLMPGCGTI